MCFISPVIVYRPGIGNLPPLAAGRQGAPAARFSIILFLKGIYADISANGSRGRPLASMDISEPFLGNESWHF